MTSSANIFLYGSLIFPSVYRAVTGTERPMVDAILPGYRRFGTDQPSSHGCPVVVPSPSHHVCGKVIFGVSLSELAILDLFEEVQEGLYMRDSVTVLIERAEAPAFVYVCGPTSRDHLCGEWCPEEFEARYLEEFLRGPVRDFSLSLKR